MHKNERKFGLKIYMMRELTYTRTGTKSSAAGTALSWARLNKFMIIADTLEVKMY